MEEMGRGGATILEDTSSGVAALPIFSDTAASDSLSPQEIADRLREALHGCNDLRRAPWKGDANPFAGHCYIASEAFCHLTGAKPRVTRFGHSTHWWAVLSEQVFDLTAEQFSEPVPYSEGKGCGFLTKQPSKRAMALLERASLSHLLAGS